MTIDTLIGEEEARPAPSRPGARYGGTPDHGGRVDLHSRQRYVPSVSVRLGVRCSPRVLSNSRWGNLMEGVGKPRPPAKAVLVPEPW